MPSFYKYHGAWNDFIVIDNRKGFFDDSNLEKIKLLCHRRFGIGADGILLLKNPPQKGPPYDFEMVYINSDGSSGSMCGNGGRCIVHFAHNILKIIKNPKKIKFLAVDGAHEAQVLKNGKISLKMRDVEKVDVRNKLPFVCQGTTPHNIMFVRELEKFPVVSKGRRVRNSDPVGVNVNFVELKDGIFHVRTYEKGVEDETWACGTGATSVAIAAHHFGYLRENVCNVRMKGGDLTVKFKKAKKGPYKDIWLIGDAKCVFECTLT